MTHTIKCLLLSFIFLSVSSVYAAGVYEGERNAFNRFHGKGTYQYANGNIYNGEWKDGRKSGKGIQTWANGDKYQGQWMENRQNGQGTMTWVNGDEYVGQWVGGKRHGKGVMKWANKSIYDGEWVKNKRQGFGEYTATGGVYKGLWEADQQHGQGALIRKDGSKIAGTWHKGLVSGDANVTQSDGSRYTGPMKDNQPHGKGVCKKDGSLFPCEYKAGVLWVNKAKPKATVAEKPKLKVIAKPKSVKPAVKNDKAVETLDKQKDEPDTIQRNASVNNDSLEVIAALTAEPPAAGKRFSFNHNWEASGMSNIRNAWVERDVNQIGDLKIRAEGDYVVVLMIDEYFGPGEYDLRYFKGSITKPGVASYQTTSSQPGKVTIVEETESVIKGVFEFKGYRNGSPITGESRIVQSGQFILPIN